MILEGQMGRAAEQAKEQEAKKPAKSKDRHRDRYRPQASARIAHLEWLHTEFESCHVSIEREGTIQPATNGLS